MPGLTMIMTPREDSAPLLSTSMSINEIADRLAAMQYQESTSYRCHDYIDRGEHSASSSRSRRRQREESQKNLIIDRDCRSKMCEWCYQVTDFCEFRRETVAMGMNYLDRFLATSSPRAARAMRNKKEFQLVAMTTMYIAIKLFEQQAMDPALLSQISQGCYTEEDVVEMEKEILESLSWRVNGPTTHAFLDHLMALLPPSAYGHVKTTALSILEFSRFQANIAVSDYDLSLQKPSNVALAAFLNSAEGIEKSLFPARSRFQFFRLVANASGMNPFSPEINIIRTRLLHLFSENSGYNLPQIANLTPVMKAEQFVTEEKNSNNKKPLLARSSPVSVARRYEKPGTYGARSA